MVDFNKTPVNSTATHKDLGMILGSKLSYENHLQSVFSRVNKSIGLLKKFQPTLPRKSLMTIYKSFVRPHLDYGDVIYDRASNGSLHQSLESLQYSTAIGITGAIRGTSSGKLFQELGLETLKSRRWLRKLCLFYKLIKEKSLAYLFQLIPENGTPYTKRSVQKSQNPLFQDKSFFKNSFFPAVILERNKLDIGNSASCNVFKRVILKFIRPEPNRVFNVDSSEGLKFLTRIRLGLCHLADHKFRHNFQDCVNPVCSCGQEVEKSISYFTVLITIVQDNLFEKVNKTDSSILKQNDQVITKLLLFGNEKLKAAQNKPILTSTMEFLQATKRFKTSLFN